MKLEDYGFIGDTHTGALVGINGSIDWLCTPRFDSDACFAALLGSEEKRPLADQPPRAGPTGQPRLPGRDSHPRNHLRDGQRHRPADRLHAAARPLPRRGPDRRGGRGPGRPGTAADRPLRLRADDPLGEALRGGPHRRGGAERARPARRRPHLRRGPDHAGPLQRRKRGAQDLRPDLASLARAAAGGGRRRKIARRNRGALDEMVGPLHLPGRIPRRRGPLASHPQGADLRPPPAGSWRP